MKKALVLVLTQDPSMMQGPNHTTNSTGTTIPPSTYKQKTENDSRIYTRGNACL
jgi:hypothetical protein